MTRKEAERRNHQESALLSLGFTSQEAEQLRRISMTLHRWHELECGVDNGGVERDEQTGKVVWYNAMTGKRTPYADRETPALKRLQAIVDARNGRTTLEESTHGGVVVSAYVQGDPRGAALYLIRPGDVPDGGSVDAYYTRGIVVY